MFGERRGALGRDGDEHQNAQPKFIALAPGAGPVRAHHVTLPNRTRCDFRPARSRPPSAENNGRSIDQPLTSVAFNNTMLTFSVKKLSYTQDLAPDAPPQNFQWGHLTDNLMVVFDSFRSSTTAAETMKVLQATRVVVGSWIFSHPLHGHRTGLTSASTTFPSSD